MNLQTSKFLIKLSKDYVNLFETGEFHDTLICAGLEPNYQEFKAHSLILRSRSQYFKNVLSSECVKTKGNLVIFSKSNISPEIFKIILNYLYGGIIVPAEHEVPVILELLRATDELSIDDLSEFIQDYLSSNPWILMPFFAIVHRFASKESKYSKIRKCVLELLKENPATIFDSIDYTSLDQEALLVLFKSHNFLLKPVVLWKNLIEWGIAKIHRASDDLSVWKLEDFHSLGIVLNPFIPFIKFMDMSLEDFSKEVTPWRQSLEYESQGLYSIIEQYLLNPSKIQENKLLQNPYDYVNSILMTPNDAKIIAEWINNAKAQNDTRTQTPINTYKFNLIFRGSEHGFTPELFHKHCDEKGPTLTLLRVESTGEILGGFNPLSWHSNVICNYSPTTQSFIFTLGDKAFYYNPVVSEIEDYSKAIYQSEFYGPCFGGGESDLRLFGDNFKDEDKCRCIKNSYKKKIRESEEMFHVDELEVFQVLLMS
ncbi:12647_t:CDS:2 [Acaulospora morrowiae]|uniref:12647_t:CDS:1 n=1 Tax=Acaulospora morrowiae TaxID=94023 RepID=A0A9N9C1T9_9GLOM|nr:12647_t:CDS:2 [Acaulospora morrowiae]